MTMTEFKYSEQTSNESNYIIEVNCINTKGTLRCEKTFSKKTTEGKIQAKRLEEVKSLKYKR